MKKILISILTAVCLLAPVSALEWGGLVNEEAKFTKTDGNAFKQSNSAFLWVNVPFGAWSLAAEGMYKYTLDIVDDTNTFNNIIDLDLFKFSGTIKTGSSTISLAAGRFFVGDNTNANFAQCCDGLSVNAGFKKFNINAYFGYTGLLNSLNVSILGAQPETVNQFYTLCHAYVPAMVSFELPSILGNQSIALQGEAFLDVGSADKYNRFYGNLKVGGPIVGTVYYNLVTSFGFTNDAVMNYSNFTVSAYPSSSLAINAGVDFASGDMGFLKPYTTFTSKTAYNSASAPEMSGCIVPSVDCIFTTGAMFVNVAAKAPILMPEKKATFGGVEADLTFIYNIFSDLQAEFDFGYYKDVATDGADDSLSATVKAAISF